MSLVSPSIVRPIAVVGVKQVDVLVIVTGQELCRQKESKVLLISFNAIKADSGPFIIMGKYSDKFS